MITNRSPEQLCTKNSRKKAQHLLGMRWRNCQGSVNTLQNLSAGAQRKSTRCHFYSGNKISGKQQDIRANRLCRTKFQHHANRNSVKANHRSEALLCRKGKQHASAPFSVRRGKESWLKFPSRQTIKQDAYVTMIQQFMLNRRKPETNPLNKYILPDTLNEAGI